jgi:hypothetical protein
MEHVTQGFTNQDFRIKISILPIMEKWEVPGLGGTLPVISPKYL